MSFIDSINTIFNEAECLFDASQVESALDKMAEAITNDLNLDNPLFIAVLTGAMIPMGHLLTRLNFPLEVDYIHATRYDGDIKGSDLKWIVKPRISLQGRTVVIVDDIYDEGYTLDAIIKYCDEKGASQIKSAVLVEKEHQRGLNFNADYIGLKIPDRYVFGYGMDYKGYLRNTNGIFAVKGL